MATILLVEDDSMNREMISRYLLLEGYTVVTAVNGMRAVTIAADNPPDLILMDMGLPLMDGWEAVRRIRETMSNRAMPIIALTAYVMSDERERCLAVGCNDYESKPVDFPQLLEKIKKLL